MKVYKCIKTLDLQTMNAHGEFTSQTEVIEKGTVWEVDKIEEKKDYPIQLVGQLKIKEDGSLVIPYIVIDEEILKQHFEESEKVIH